MKRQRIYLYGEPSVNTLDTLTLVAYIKSLLPGMRVEARTAFIPWHLSTLSTTEKEQKLEYLAERFAIAKVRDTTRCFQEITPLAGEVNYEKRRLGLASHDTFGLLYDGFEVMYALAELIPREERGLSALHIAFTNQLLGTWEGDDRRYHARVAIFGYPALLSTSGVVEAPARPREYYLMKQRYRAMNMSDATILGLDRHFGDRFIDYNDMAMTGVMKGYMMQALFYHLTGNPFCEDRDCRLYNAHWQEEVIQAQLKSNREFCPLHEQALQKLGEAFDDRAESRSSAE